jgi:hypothetical protein
MNENKPTRLIQSFRSTYNRKTGKHNRQPVFYVQQVETKLTKRVSFDDGLRLIKTSYAEPSNDMKEWITKMEVTV